MFFITIAYVLSWLWQQSFHWLIMGKVKIGIFFFLPHWRYFDKSFTVQNVPWIVPYVTYEFCPNCLFWLAALATKTLNLQKVWKTLLFRSHKEDEAELFKFSRNVHNINFYKLLCFFYTLPHNNGGVLWFHFGRPCVCLSVCFSFLDDN